ncbi:TDP-4-oxo-6-deoxy-alpha-D-glucose-3,4-oxoisomerase [bioreactor metagenome]|uniref:TDP-4-oxo-6-deoxy-alpha-D-glucose-3, 4-oxoisomerase n=1 Tax=bioreactor metagenome TaxID=1076179 RepID=A0A644XTY4_9ZZZZ|nr:WxcM-like domain-containing protein [Synergistaceae bacterium]
MEKLLQLQKITSEEARIFVFEGEKFDFDVKRIYFTRDVPVGQIRGHHAHKTLQQVLLCPHGAIRVTLDDGLGNKESAILDTPEKGLYVGPALWRTMEWLKPESLLLVFASQNYIAEDYIRDYDLFLGFARNQFK